MWCQHCPGWRNDITVLPLFWAAKQSACSGRMIPNVDEVILTAYTLYIEACCTATVVAERDV
jgi:hypothetical protein